MEQEDAATRTVVLHVPFVRKCVEYLRTRRIHRQFVGYLCVCEAAAVAGRSDGLQPAFRAFFERFLTTADAPQGTPYLIPFNDAAVMESSVWLNSNIAGSYAPSSIRSQAPIRRVVDIYGAGRQATYALRDGHGELCREHLLYGERIDPLALAGFLFRDHGFTLYPGEILSTFDLIAAVYSLLNLAGSKDRTAVFDGSQSSLSANFLFESVATKV